MRTVTKCQNGFFLQQAVVYCDPGWGGGRTGLKKKHVWDGQGINDPCFLVLNQNVWDGQELKDSCFFGTFSRITKS
jgi:hypothetical protein